MRAVIGRDFCRGLLGSSLHLLTGKMPIPRAGDFCCGLLGSSLHLLTGKMPIPRAQVLLQRPAEVVVTPDSEPTDCCDRPPRAITGTIAPTRRHAIGRAFMRIAPGVVNVDNSANQWLTHNHDALPSEVSPISRADEVIEAQQPGVPAAWRNHEIRYNNAGRLVGKDPRIIIAHWPTQLLYTDVSRVGEILHNRGGLGIRFFGVRRSFPEKYTVPVLRVTAEGRSGAGRNASHLGDK